MWVTTTGSRSVTWSIPIYCLPCLKLPKGPSKWSILCPVTSCWITTTLPAPGNCTGWWLKRVRPASGWIINPAPNYARGEVGQNRSGACQNLRQRPTSGIPSISFGYSLWCYFNQQEVLLQRDEFLLVSYNQKLILSIWTGWTWSFSAPGLLDELDQPVEEVHGFSTSRLNGACWCF